MHKTKTIQKKKFCTYTTRDATHRPPHIDVAHLGTSRISTFLDRPSEWFAATSMEAVTPHFPPSLTLAFYGPNVHWLSQLISPVLMKIPLAQSHPYLRTYCRKSLDHLPLSLYLHHVAVALFIAFVAALYVSCRHVSHDIPHILAASHKT